MEMKICNFLFFIYAFSEQRLYITRKPNLSIFQSLKKLLNQDSYIICSFDKKIKITRQKKMHFVLKLHSKSYDN